MVRRSSGATCLADPTFNRRKQVAPATYFESLPEILQTISKTLYRCTDTAREGAINLTQSVVSEVGDNSPSSRADNHMAPWVDRVRPDTPSIGIEG